MLKKTIALLCLIMIAIPTNCMEKDTKLLKKNYAAVLSEFKSLAEKSKQKTKDYPDKPAQLNIEKTLEELSDKGELAEQLTNLTRTLMIDCNDKEKRELAEKELILFLYKNQTFVVKHFSLISDILAKNHFYNFEHHLRSIKKAYTKKLIEDAVILKQLEKVKELASDEANLALKPYEELLDKLELNDEYNKIAIYYGINYFIDDGTLLQKLIHSDCILIGQNSKIILDFIQVASDEDLDAHIENGPTALYETTIKWQLSNSEQAKQKYKEIIQALLQNGANPEILNSKLRKATYSIFFTSNDELCKLWQMDYIYSQYDPSHLQKIESDEPNKTRFKNLIIDNQGNRLLQQLIQSGEDDGVILAFIQNTTTNELDAQDANGYTALQIAEQKWAQFYKDNNPLKEQYHVIILALLKHGANPGIHGNESKQSDPSFFTKYRKECRSAQAEYRAFLDKQLSSTDSNGRKKSIVSKVLKIALPIVGIITVAYFGYKYFDNNKINNAVNVK